MSEHIKDLPDHIDETIEPGAHRHLRANNIIVFVSHEEDGVIVDLRTLDGDTLDGTWLEFAEVENETEA